MAVYDVNVNMNYIGSYNCSITVKNNSNVEIGATYWDVPNGNYTSKLLYPTNTFTYGTFSINQFIVYAPNGNIMFMYIKSMRSVPAPGDIHFVYYIDETGKVVTRYETDISKFVNYSVSKLSDTISPGGLSTLHIDDTRVEQINYNNKSYTSFPVDIPLVPNVKAMTVIGKTFNVQLDNELNIVRVKDGQTEYRQFPATIMVGENKTLQLYGKEDPEITIDYTGTQDPVISNTPVTPPPVV